MLIFKKISRLLPVYSKKTSLIEIDVKTFKEGEMKEMQTWCWKCMKHIKFIVQCKNEKFHIHFWECPHRYKDDKKMTGK